MQKKWIFLLSAGLTAALLLGALAVVPPLLRARIQKEATARGLQLSLGELSLSWGRLELQQIQLSPQGVPALQAELDRVLIDWSWSAPRIRALHVRGGHVQIDGPVSVVEEQLRAFRAQHLPSSSGGDSASRATGRSLRVQDLELTWTSAEEPGKKQTLRGVHFERGSQGQKLHVEQARFEYQEWIVSAEEAELHWLPGTTRLERVVLDRAQVSYQASSPPSPSSPTDSVPSDSPGLLQRFRASPERVLALQLLLRRLREDLFPELPEEVRISHLSLLFEKGSDRLQLGPQSFQIQQTPEAVRFQLLPPKSSSASPLSWTATIPRDEQRPLRTQLSGGPIPLGLLGVQTGNFGLHNVDTSQIELSVQAELSPDARWLDLDGHLSWDSFVLFHERLAPEPLHFPRLAGSGALRFAVDGSQASWEKVQLEIGEARFLTDMKWERGPEHVVLELDWRAPAVSCQALLEAAPSGLLGPVAGLNFEGTFSLESAVRADTRQLAAMQVRWDLKNGCRVRQVPAQLHPDRFRSVFERPVRTAHGERSTQHFGPGTPQWTPLPQVTHHLLNALLVTEDGRFHRHQGFDNRAIESSIRDNTLAGRFVRGASTLSMQLAKNLYLSQEKQLSRKLQEAALTLVLEQHFTKQELLELYVNIVEFGPGVYGVQEAAEYYFATTPNRLTIAQSFFLASLLPAPTREYFLPTGALSERRKTYVHQLLRIAQQRELLSPAELESALQEELVRGQASTTPASSEDPPSDPARALPEHSLSPLPPPPTEPP